MADISKITLPNGSEYNIKDAIARAKFPVSIADGGTGKTNAIDGMWALEDRGYSSDANSALSVGIYNTNTNTANLPDLAYSQGNGCGILVVYVSTTGTHNNTNNWIWQLWFNTSTSDLYKRRKVNNGSWLAWTADAATLKTSRSFNVGGHATGTAQSFNGSQNITIPVTSFNTQGLVRPSGLRGLNDVTLQTLVNTTRANRLAFLPADQIIIEQTVDGGTTWTSAGISDGAKVALFSETRQAIYLPKIDNKMNLLCGLRITFTAMKYDVPSGTAETAKYNYWSSDYVLSQERYCQLKEMYFWINTSNNTMSVKAERATGANPNNWSTIFNDDSFYMNGWSGCNYIRFSQAQFGGGTNQTGQPWNYRLTFMTKGLNGTDTMGTGYETQTQSVMEIRGYGDTWWGKSNEYMANDKLYTHDYNKNVTFPANITASGSMIASGLTVAGKNVVNDYLKTYTRSDIGTTPNYDNPNANGLFELRPSSELPNATGTRPFDGYGPMLSVKAENIAMLQLSGQSVTGKLFWRGKQSANVNMSGVNWRTILDNQTYPDYTVKKDGTGATGTWPIGITGSAAKVNNHTVETDVPSNAVFTDTKNTAGSTDSSSKLFLIGATSQAENPQTYSQDTAYVGTDGCLYSGGTKVLTSHQSLDDYASGIGISGSVVTIYNNNGVAIGSITLPTSLQSGISFSDPNNNGNINISLT